MESIGVGPWIAIVVAVGAIGVLVGYWLGTKMGGHNTEPMRELHREQKAYKEDVREHFEQVSATMTRMVEDYREMYNHVAKGAEKLADMHHETVIEPPPKPEAITQDHRADADESDAPAGEETRDSDVGKTEPRKTEPAASAASSSPSAAKPSPSATAPTASGAAAKSSAASSASGKAPAKTAPETASETSTSASGSSAERPQDAAIRAAAEDAATAQKR